MNKHTPAPWQLIRPNRKKKATQFDHNQEVLIMASGTTGSRFSIGTIGGPSNIEMIDEFVANARLIAAAPELLEALKAAVQELEWLDRNALIKSRAGGDYIEVEGLNAARAAITKATGKTS